MCCIYFHESTVYIRISVMFFSVFSPLFQIWKTSKPTSGVLCLSGKDKEWCFSAGRPLTLEVSTTSSSFIFHLHLIFPEERSSSDLSALGCPICGSYNPISISQLSDSMCRQAQWPSGDGAVCVQTHFHSNLPPCNVEQHPSLY